MEHMKGYVFVGYNAEYLSCAASAAPFAVGFAVLAFDKKTGRFETAHAHDLKLLVEIDHDKVEAETLEWWTKNHLDLFTRLTDATQQLSYTAAAAQIVQYLTGIGAAFPGHTVVFASDDEAHQMKVDRLLELGGQKWLRYHNSPENYARSLNLDGFFECYDFGGGFPQAADISTVHKHTHDPLDDALEMLEKFQVLLNWRL